MNIVTTVRGAVVIAIAALVGWSADNGVGMAPSNAGQGARGPEIVYASKFGFNPGNATAALQSAIDSGARKIVVENLGMPWIVNPIRLAGDQEVVFEKGVEVQAMRGAFQGVNDCLFSAISKRNVTLTGDGATFRMWKEDYLGNNYKKSEWRHTLAIRSCTNVKITGLTMLTCGGDGIYLGVDQKGTTNTNVRIDNVTCLDGNRQGISVISAENLLIENCLLKGTIGHAPEAGIDFEPNYPSDRLVNAVVRGCRSENNHGNGYCIYLPALTAQSTPVSIRFEDCLVRDCFVGVTVRSGKSKEEAVPGIVEFQKCVIKDCEHYGIMIIRPAIGCTVRFKECEIINTAEKYPKEAPLGVMSEKGDPEVAGGVEFISCRVTDSLERPPLFYKDNGSIPTLGPITGDIEIMRGSQRGEYILSEPLIRAWVTRKPVPKELVH